MVSRIKPIKRLATQEMYVNLIKMQVEALEEHKANAMSKLHDSQLAELLTLGITIQQLVNTENNYRRSPNGSLA